MYTYMLVIVVSFFLQDDVELEIENMKTRLKFHFMNPFQKWKNNERRRFPWKLITQLLALIIVTTQVSNMGENPYVHIVVLCTHDCYYLGCVFVNFTNKCQCTCMYIYNYIIINWSVIVVGFCLSVCLSVCLFVCLLRLDLSNCKVMHHFNDMLRKLIQ